MAKKKKKNLTQFQEKWVHLQSTADKSQADEEHYLKLEGVEKQDKFSWNFTLGDQSLKLTSWLKMEQQGKYLFWKAAVVNDQLLQVLVWLSPDWWITIKGYNKWKLPRSED